MLRNIWFQAHWFVGITAGVVLAVVGLTGAMLAFETPLQQWLNRDTRTVAVAGSAAMTPSALIESVAQQAPDKRVTTLQFWSDSEAAARVGFAPAANASGGANSGRGPARGESRYVNPYTGELLEPDAARGQKFFRTTRSVHRWLTLDTYGNQALGRQIVGACTALCIVLALSGLYLRWPRRIGNWRVWLTFNPRLKGRAFLWHLHAVLGTWVLLGFLLMSLTGLYWSYNWYRDGLYSLAGVQRPAGREQGPRAAAGPDRRAQRGDQGEGAREAPGPSNLDAAWTSFTALPDAAQFKTATVTFEPGRPIEVRYLHADARHDRANSTAQFDPRTGVLLKHEPYGGKRTGEKFMASIFPLHSGSFFGLPGTVLYMIASLGMPVFTITGWMMYLDRRRKKQAAQLRQETSAVLERN